MNGMNSVGMTPSLVNAIVKELVFKINRERRAAKDGWYFVEDTTYRFRLKGYGTWIQRIELYDTNGKSYIVMGSPHELKVREYSKWLTDILHCIKAFHAE